MIQVVNFFHININCTQTHQVLLNLINISEKTFDYLSRLKNFIKTYESLDNIDRKMPSPVLLSKYPLFWEYLSESKCLRLKQDHML